MALFIRQFVFRSFSKAFESRLTVTSFCSIDQKCLLTSDSAADSRNEAQNEEYFKALFNKTRPSEPEQSSTDIVPAEKPKDLPTNSQDKLISRLPLSTQIDKEFLETVAPPVRKSFNLATYAESSEILQQLIKLGVDLYAVECHRSHVYQSYLMLDFEKDVKPRIQFLHEHGLLGTELGTYISRNPLIFQQDMDSLETRIQYLKSKGFSQSSITRIISHCPTWLNFHTKAIDGRLGFLQKTFKLTGQQVRQLISKQPKLGIFKLDLITRNNFAFLEEMGFQQAEMKELLLKRPRLWLERTEILNERFQYLHNEIGISHKLILEFPGVLSSRKFIVHQRHEYLKKLGRAQYDPALPNYVSLKALVSGRDAEFCVNVAKTFVADFNEFLKTM